MYVGNEVRNPDSEAQKFVPHLLSPLLRHRKRKRPNTETDRERCLMISTRMSAKQLYFPRISRAQRGPFFSRNPLFVKGSTPRLWKQLAWSSSHADSTTFVLSKLSGQVMRGYAQWGQLLPNICYPPFAPPTFFSSGNEGIKQKKWSILADTFWTFTGFSKDFERFICPVWEYAFCVPAYACLTISASQLSERFLQGSTLKHLEQSGYNICPSCTEHSSGIKRSWYQLVCTCWRVCSRGDCWCRTNTV